MPIYDYECPTHGKFEAFNNIVSRGQSGCPQCGQPCPMIISEVNDFMAKTKYIPPPSAKRKFGDKNRTSHRRAKWL